MRLAYYQAANVARQRDPQLAAHYRKLMCERGHTHIQANCAVARKLAARTWAVLTIPADTRRRNRATNPRRGRLDRDCQSPAC